MNIRTVPTQKWRAFLLLVYLALMLCVSKFIFGEYIPSPSGGKAVWFYTGLASLLLGNYLVTPYFSKPVDAISYAFAATVALVGAANLANWQASEKLVYFAVLTYCIVIVGVSFLAIFTRNNSGDVTARISKTAALLASTLGNHRAVFGLTMMAAAYLFHRDSVMEILSILIICIIVVVARPEEIIAGVFIKLRDIWANVLQVSVFGNIVAQQMPKLVLIRKNDDAHPKFASLLAVKVPGRKVFPALSLDVIGRDESTLVRAIELVGFGVADIRAFIDSYKSVPDNSVLDIPSNIAATAYLGNTQLHYIEEFIGLVAQDTSSERLFIEIINTKNLYEGLLVEVNVQGEKVIYQLLDGLTKEEIIHQKNTLGFVRAQAKKVGVWDVQKKRFCVSKWLPNLNEPVFLSQSNEVPIEIDTIGRFPGGSYPVQLKDIHALVTHNTAILGILGVGKSMLAIELVERMVAEKIKVICLDLTDQYSTELSSNFDMTVEDVGRNKLYLMGSSGKTNFSQNVDEGGSVKIVKKALCDEIRTFLSSASCNLKIFNPARFEVWKQDSKPFNGTASMLSLTACQVTQLISEATLECVQQLGAIDRARICMVYEEAHSLVPEWNSVAFEGDKAATAGTARAILQGRKYGMGCLLVTQRTANVTKTILNQCNSIFAMRTFDDTGKEFLSNYVGRDYANALSSLPERHAVFFGRASSCENPVLIKLNDREDFKDVFRKNFPLPEMPAVATAGMADSAKNEQSDQ